MRNRILIATTMGVVSAASPALHADPVLDYSIGVSIEHSDNINLSADNPVSQNVLTPQLAFSIKQEGSAVTATAAGNLQYRDYLGGAFGDEVRSFLSGIAAWHLLPERLDWVFEDYLGRQPINVLQSDAPNNQQQTNVFSTGPTLKVHLGGSLDGEVDLRYTNSHAEETKDFNSDRYSGSGRLIYKLGTADTLSATATATDVRYNEAESRPFNYDRKDAYLGYQHKTDQFLLDLAGGYSWVDLNDSSGSRSGALLRAGLQWNPSPATSLGVTARRQFSDASQDLVFAPLQLQNLGIGSGLNGAIVAPQLYVEKRLDVDFNHTFDERLRFGVAPFVRRLHYIQGDFFDDHAFGYYADVAYYLRPTLWLGGYVGHERRDYTNIDRVDDDLTYGLTANWQRTRHWLLTLTAAHQRRNSDVEEFGYKENAVTLSVTYQR